MSDSDAEQAGEIRRAGDSALLVIPPVRSMVADLVAALRPRPAGVQDVLPAAETVLVTLVSPAAVESVRRRLDALLRGLDAEARVSAVAGAGGRANTGRARALGTGDRTPPAADFGPRAADSAAEEADSPLRGGRTRAADGADAEPVVIPVRYDGEDLPAVARLLGITEAEVIAQHTGVEWRCAFAGFAPGFGYLESADSRLSVPRRDRARTAIPAGAVALAGGYSAVYPRRSPGGWQLIGTTEAVMFHVDQDPPALVRAGTRVRFVDIEAGR
ncbi:carboxyltransferase domain-containing protein [Nocardia sp. NPDC005978]|uniref:5-oxoprolinase subunit B family protein n=1 Tax=Nocardia sp. NPDC005978 TaxID=3156725 RepID=UPI0033BDF5BC